MSISLATKGIVFVAKTVVEYHVVSVCEPDVTSHEHGERYMTAKELKPSMRTKTPS